MLSHRLRASVVLCCVVLCALCRVMLYCVALRYVEFGCTVL